MIRNEKKESEGRSANDVVDANMTMTDSPHVQWFSYDDIVHKFSMKGFVLREFTGSSLFSGVVINSFLKPRRVYCNINNFLGSLFPKMASGYYFCFVKEIDEES